MKKILIISPTPTHPTNVANRLHMLLLTEFLQQNGFEVHFFYIAVENFNKEDMYTFWGDRLYIFERDKVYSKRNLIKFYFKRVGEKLKKVKRFLQVQTGIISELQYKYNEELDACFPSLPEKELKKLQQKKKFDIVICEYALTSKVLTFFKNDVYKVIDAHDCFTDRFNVFLKSNLKPDWISLYKDQEQKALNRANLVIALQDEEKEYFQSISSATVIRFNLIQGIKKLPVRNFEKKLLYIASNNSINIKTLDYFETMILPLIKEKHPDVKFLVGGSICDNYTKKDDNTILIGFFNTVEEFYRSGDIVINPEQGGTGFKTKTLEALCFCMPVVCTKAGAAGVIKPFQQHLIVTETTEEFVNAVIRLIENDALRNTLSDNAGKWVSEIKEKFTSELLKYLPVFEK